MMRIFRKKNIRYKVCLLVSAGLFLVSPVEFYVHAEGTEKVGGTMQTCDAGKNEYRQRIFSGNNSGHLISVFTDTDGNVIAEDEESSGVTGIKSALKKSAKKESSLPTSYDPRQTGEDIPIRDQEDTGACWAFAAIRSLEMSSLKKEMVSSSDADFSENHLAWYTYNDYTEDAGESTYGDSIKILQRKEASGKEPEEYETEDKTTAYTIGGTSEIAVGILAAGTGAVYERKAPFSDSATMASAMSTADKTLRNQSDIRLTRSNQYKSSDIEEIKEQIVEHGAVDLSMYYRESALKKNSDGSYSYYQTTYDEDDANHSVTAVGFDDAYENFSAQNTPSQPGAWLIANSYGESEGEGGYFWLSYYDPSITEIASFEGVKDGEFSSCYQYDATGWNATISCDGDIYLANVFTNGEKEQAVTDVSFYTFSENQGYEINIWKHAGNENPEEGARVYAADTVGEEAHSGYHTVTLKKPVYVEPDERFSVVVKFKYDHTTVEAGVEGESIENILSREGHSGYVLYEVMRCNFGSREGESYYYTRESGEWQDASRAGYNNVCVKAFAKEISDVEETVDETTSTEPPSPAETKVPGGTNSQAETKAPAGTDYPSVTVSPTQTENSAVTSSSSGADDSKNTAVSTDSGTDPMEISAKGSIVMGCKETVKIPVTISPSKYAKKLTCVSSKPSVAKVSKSGKIKALKTGKAKITVILSDNVRILLNVTVKKKPKKIELFCPEMDSDRTITLKKGKKVKLYSKTNSGSASYHLTYQSSRKRVAVVSDKGIVRARKKGTVKIAVKTYNGKSAKIKIKII